MKVSREKLESWTEQKNHDSNCDKLRMKKSRFVSKKKGFFSSAIIKGVSVDYGCWQLTASVVHANSSISLFFLNLFYFKPHNCILGFHESEVYASWKIT